MPQPTGAEHLATTRPPTPPKAPGGGRQADHAASLPEGVPSWRFPSVRLARECLLAAGLRGEPTDIEFAARRVRAAMATALLGQAIAAARTGVVLLLKRFPGRARPVLRGARRGG